MAIATHGSAFDFTLFAVDRAWGTAVAASVDILAAASRLAPRLGAVTPRWRVCSLSSSAVTLQGGLSIAATHLQRPSPRDRSLWIVPGLGIDDGATLSARLDDEDLVRLAAGVQQHVAHGGRVAASCSSVFVLQRAGVLVDKTVTTTWWLAPLLQEREPRCTVDAGRMVCADGAIVTAGAALAHLDLMLHLLRTACGPALVDAVCRALVVDARQAQSPFIAPTWGNGDGLVARAAALIEAALPNPPRAGALAMSLAMSERTLARHLKRATGVSTSMFVQRIKWQRARLLLEGGASVEEAAAAVGYQDATALRRMTRRTVGLNPSQVRTRPTSR